jgi:hypothetical protein
MVLKETYVSTMRAVSTEASTTGASNHACFMDFQLVEIPDVMEKRLNARQGAELMRRWFDSPAFTLPEPWRLGHVNYRSVPAKNLDASIIKMSWVTGFARARAALGVLESSRTNTTAGAIELKRVLSRAGLLTGNRTAIGTVDNAVLLHETAHLNSIGVEFGGSVDALDCALGAFTMHMAVTGFVQPLARMLDSHTHEVEITKLHFYVRDSYDFTTDKEPLGHWSRDGASTFYSRGKVFVEDKHFRQWRASHGRGGDFVVFSDLKTKLLETPIRIII